MYKMLVVDDEYLVRMGIKETIDWGNHGIEIIAEGTNGKKGLDLAIELKPDLIITDIKMPVMDGLQLIKNVKKQGIDCEIIVLSGYNEFNYAKETLENGAYSYLLKPIDNNELIEKVLQALSSLKVKRNNKKYLETFKEDLPTLRKNLFTQIISGKFDLNKKIREKLALYHLNIPQRGYLIYGEIDHPEEQINNLKVEKAIIDVYTTIKNEFKSHESFGEVISTHFILLIDDELDLETIEKHCHEAIKRYQKMNKIVVSIGVSNDYKELKDINVAYKEAKQLVQNKLYPMINTVSTKNNTQRYNSRVIEAMEFISKNYHKNLTIKMVSDNLFVSESYLSHIFKENLGKTFNEYLTDYRLLIAKKMLLDRKLKIYEIAEKVGYNDAKYFSQIFRKKEGISPSEYVESEEVHEETKN